MSANRKTVKKYLDYIGHPIDIDTLQYNPITEIEYRKKIKKDERDSSNRFYFLEKMKEIETHTDSDFHFFTNIAFNKLTDTKMSSNSMLIALADYFKEKDAQPKHYHYCLEQYIRTYDKNPWKNSFFNYFQPENFDATYLCCVGAGNPTISEVIQKNEFSQAQYIYLTISNDPLKNHYTGNICFDKSIEAFFLLSLEVNTLDNKYCQHYLNHFIHTVKDLKSIRELVSLHTKENFIHSGNPFTSFLNASHLDANKEVMLTEINRHELFLSLNHALKNKTPLKLKKL